MPVYTQFAYKPKAQTTRGDIGRGQLYLEHLSPALYLELQSIKLHLHTGVDSQILPPEATPYMVRGYKLRERIERATSTWSGAAGSAGSIVITFGTSFNEIPTIVATPNCADENVQCVIGGKSKTGFTIYWKDDTVSDHTSVPIDWIAIGM
jgi:hypothetical protein